MLIAGIDEVGRGCIAGKVVAAAVILPNSYRNTSIKDSKLLTPARRNSLYEEIKNVAVSFSFGEASVAEIDQLNILQATFKAMHRAIKKLPITPQRIDVDGNQFVPYQGIPHRCIIKGDSLHIHIAAASILAKVYRDSYMKRLNQKFACYQWKNNKGYPTLAHRQAIAKHGLTAYHRTSFSIKKEA